MQPNMEVVTINSKEFIVRELSVLNIKEIIAISQKGPDFKEQSTLDWLFGNEIPGRAIELSTNMSSDDFDTLTPTEAYQLVEAVKKLNPFFMSMVARVEERAKLIQTLMRPAAG